MRARLLDPSSAAWSAEIDRIGALLHAGHNPTLFPYHFLQVVLPRLGGSILWFDDGDTVAGVGFLFPDRIVPAETAGNAAAAPVRAYTLRYHPLRRSISSGHAAEVAAAAHTLLPNAAVHFYDPAATHHYVPTDRRIDNISIGRPSAAEAAATRDLHQRIWGSPPEFLYPPDIFSADFHPGTALVARVDGQLAGFLFGFSKFDGPVLPADWATRFHGDVRLESQVMGVLPDYRGMRLGNLLKRVQAEEALARGVAVVHWTADPLQYPNAALNFGLLRALAFHHYPDLYPFRNDLNRVPASRFGLTWLVASARVRDVPLTGTRALVLDLAHHPDIRRVNDGCRVLTLDAGSEFIAVEIPADWTALQQQSLDQAQEWRAASDRLFAHYLGTQPGQYVITGVATEGERRYLIGQRVDDALWEHLAHVSEGA